MKKILFLISMLLPVLVIRAEQKKSTTIQRPMQVVIDNQRQEKMKLMLILLDATEELRTIAQIVQEDLMCSSQKLSGFAVTIQELSKIPSKRGIKQFFSDGFSVIIFLSLHGKNGIELRLYDTSQAVMQAGKYIGLQKTVKGTAHAIADQLWLLLTGQEGIFSTKIAYCKGKKEQGQGLKDIYIHAPSEQESRLLVQGGKPLAPRWNNDDDNPLLLYSEVTPVNIRLMSVNMRGKRSILSNFDGLTMVPYFSLDGQKVVYCASYKGNSQVYLYYYDQKVQKGITKQLTTNQGNNTSPNLRENGDVIFCSDFETNAPQIYYFTAQTGTVERITSGGYCACPSFSEKKGTIAYSKLVGHDMQVFLYYVATKQHKQLTFTRGNKEECSWSPCGNYLTYVVQEGVKSRIAILNMITQEQFFLTVENDLSSYPSWSPRYASI